MILKKGIDINIEDSNGRLAIFNCSTLRGGPLSLDIAEKLISLGINLEKEDNEKVTPIFSVCEKNNIELIKLLIKVCVNVNKQNDKGILIKIIKLLFILLHNMD